MKIATTTLAPLAVFMCVHLFKGCGQPSNNDGQEGPAATSRPNIIYIMADDLGYGDLGCYGQQVIMTPNIDRMADEGMKFTHCYAGSAVCAPSRSVLMTGLHTGHTLVRGNKSRMVDKPDPYNRVPLRPTDTTVAEVLKKAGYVTGITGKWGLGEPGTTGVPNKKGFDQWLGYLNQAHAHNYYPEYIWKNGDRYPLPENKDDGEEQYTHDLFIDFALDFIRAQRDTTFFLYYSITLPHSEYEIPVADLEPYREMEWAPDAKVHAAMVTRLDREVGQIMDLLRALQIDEHTLVFFCSDNGAARRWEGRFDSSGLLRGHKRDMYEGGLRTPMIVWMPGMVPAGTLSDYTWYFADVMATLADVAGVAPAAGTDGISVWPVVRGEEVSPPDRFLYWEFHAGGFSQAARWKDWKAVRLSHEGAIELYNLVEDPGEERDISAEHPGVVDMFSKYLDTARTSSYYWPLPGEAKAENL